MADGDFIAVPLWLLKLSHDLIFRGTHPQSTGEQVALGLIELTKIIQRENNGTDKHNNQTND